MTIVVTGIGSEYRHDDGAGPAVAQRLVARLPVVSDIGPIAEPLDLLGRWDGADLAIVVDAVRSGADPGTITLVEVAGAADDAVAVAGSVTSTHGIGLVGALGIARAIDAVPVKLIVVGIEGVVFSAGVGLSPAVADAVTQATERVVALVGRWADV
jgi:hydrogenase maturation protease